MDTANISFWSAAAALLLILEGCLWFGFKKRKDNSSQEPSLNRLVYQDEFQALQREFSNGQLSKRQYDESVKELEVRILEDNAGETVSYRDRAWIRPVSLALFIVLPVLAIVLYFQIANPSLMTYSGTPEAAAQSSKGNSITQLQRFLKENPKDVRAWLALSDAYAGDKQFKEAASAMDEAMKYSPNGVAVLPDYLLKRAVYRLESGDPILRSEAVSDIDKALKEDPENTRALELGGMVAYSTGNYRKAADYWQELLLQLPPDSRAYSRLLDAVADAKNRAGMGF